MEHATLRDLLQKAADRGMSLRQIEEAVDAQRERSGVEMRLNRGTASLILTGKYKSRPSDATVRAVAYLARVPVPVAFEAAGLPAPGVPFAEELPDEVDALSPKRRKVALEVLRSLIDAELQEHELERLRAASDAASEPVEKGPAPGR